MAMQIIKKKMMADIFYKMVLGMLLCLSVSCEKFVAVDLPASELTSGLVFQDLGTANAAVANLYVDLRDRSVLSGNVNGLSVLLGYYSDELVYYSAERNDFYQNSLQAEVGEVANVWNNTYNLIYDANLVLEGLSSSTKLADKDKQILSGQALFIRAYAHFYLVNLFGSIPYIKTTDYQKNQVAGKLTPKDVYASIQLDLQQAWNFLPDAYITTDRGRPNRSVVKALMARTYLYAENWIEAEKAATEVLGRTDLYNWVDDLDKVFLNDSEGTLWQLISRVEGMNTNEAISFIFTSGPPTQKATNVALVNAFEADDLRKTKWLGSVSKDANTWYFPYKYKENKTTPSSKEYSILFRLEELYLIKSEALANMDELPQSRQLLNKIRNRAGLNDVAANTKPALLTAILKERRVEFFSEQGHRWFDLKRTGQANAALTGVKAGWNPTDILWPLPENELRLNANLKPQNSGY